MPKAAGVWESSVPPPMWLRARILSPSYTCATKSTEGGEGARGR